MLMCDIMNLSQSRKESFFVSRQRAVNLFSIPVTVTSTGNSRLTALCFGDTMDRKKCAKCGSVKPLNEFVKNRNKKGGFSSYCIQCERERAAEWRKNHSDRKSASNRAWYKNNARKVCEKIKNIRHSDMEKAREESRAWRKAHPDKIREITRRIYLRNRAEDPDRYTEYSNRRRALKQKNGGNFTAQEWAALKKKYNYTCLRCGRKEPEIRLTLDHVKPLYLGGQNTIENSQPLCKTCNSSKGIKWIDYRGSTS